MVLAGMVCLHPKVFRLIANFVLARLRLPLLPVAVTIGDYARPIALLLTTHLIGGAALWLTISSVTILSPVWLPLCVSAMALAGSLGLLALFAPAGLGVREGILLIILGPIAGVGTSAIVVVLARVLSILVELAAAGIGFVVLRTADQRRPNLA